MARKPLIAGNWKMNRGPSATREYFRDFKERWAPRADRTVLFFPPAVSLTTAAEMVRDRPDLALGAQNIHWEAEGAFTGEISIPMLAALGVAGSIVGHSERRQLFGETDAALAAKVPALLEAGMLAILCVGETEDERDAGETEEVLRRHSRGAEVVDVDRGDVGLLGVEGQRHEGQAPPLRDLHQELRPPAAQEEAVHQRGLDAPGQVLAARD